MTIRNCVFYIVWVIKLAVACSDGDEECRPSLEGSSLLQSVHEIVPLEAKEKATIHGRVGALEIDTEAVINENGEMEIGVDNTESSEQEEFEESDEEFGVDSNA